MQQSDRAPKIDVYTLHKKNKKIFPDYFQKKIKRETGHSVTKKKQNFRVKEISGQCGGQTLANRKFVLILYSQLQKFFI